MSDDGNRQVALTVERVAVELGLNAEQFSKLLELGAQQDLQLGAINDTINKLAESIAEPDENVAAEIRSLKQEITVGFADTQRSIANLNNTIHDRAVDLAKWLAAIALAAANPADNTAAVQAKIDEITRDLRTSSDTVEEAINQDKSKG